MKRDTRAKAEDDAFCIGNLKILGVDYVIARVLSRNKIPEDKFLLSVDDDGTVMYAIAGSAGEFSLLAKGKVIGYYKRTLASEQIDDDLRVKPSLRRDLIDFLESCGFIKKLK